MCTSPVDVIGCSTVFQNGAMIEVSCGTLDTGFEGTVSWCVLSTSCKNGCLDPATTESCSTHSC
jgi:hypothetical protein